MIWWWLTFVTVVCGTALWAYGGWLAQSYPMISRAAYGLGAVHAVVALACFAWAIEASIPRL